MVEEATPTGTPATAEAGSESEPILSPEATAGAIATASAPTPETQEAPTATTTATTAASTDKVGSVLVVGGGISGMQSSLDLADSGFKVYLLDTLPSIGGVMSQLDKTFPTNDCSMCIMAPKLVATGRHQNIHVISNADLEKLEGEPGKFKATIKKRARKVDEEKCTGCGVCAEKCPMEAIDEYNMGMVPRSSIFVRYAQAVPLVFAIDPDKCIGCGICAEECKANAVEYEQEDSLVDLDVGSVILSPGFEPFNPIVKEEYGYGVYKNVLTSMEFERFLSATGPYAGTVLRPSDGEVPKNVAFIQCVGSREDPDKGGNPYCSAVCCMYAMKEAVIAQEHTAGLEPHIFFMDIRAHGKEFDDYYERAEKEHGIKFTRSRVSDVQEDPITKNLIVTYVEGGEINRVEFDMVVLGIGFSPPKNIKSLTDKLGIELNKYDFCSTSSFTPLETNKPGIYVSGAFSGPKDIPDTVAQASGAAAKASSIISEARWTQTSTKEYPPERDITGEEPRIGVFICHCGINIGGVVDVPGVVEYAKTLPNVVYSEHNLYTCSEDTQGHITEMIKEHNLNRTIVASCTPRTHEPLFRNTTAEGGLNPYLFEMANIRDQCSWVHMHEEDKATAKAKDLVRMAVAKSKLLEPLQKMELPLNKTVIVLGGGLSGMTIALELAKQGYENHLVEKEAELGGNLRHIHYTLSQGGNDSGQAEDPQAKLKELIDAVNGNDKITVHTNTTLKEVEGFVGNFKSTLTSNGNDEAIEHGIVIIATGAYEYKPTKYLYGENPNVMTQRELEAKLAKGEFDANSIVMIQCVGSRDDEFKWCSRTCCSEAVKNALKIKEVKPDAKVYVLYKDVRTFGFREDYFRDANEKGVRFIRYDDEHKPEVSDGGKLTVKVPDFILDKSITLNPDQVVLSAGTHPNPDNEDIGKLLKIPLNKYKYFLEAHMKLRPVDFATEGVFLAGLAHGPKFIDESISQAAGTVARAATILSRDSLEVEPQISNVVDENCDGCAYCIDPCPYSALTLIEYMRGGAIKKTVEVNEAACKGCGVCQATCPKKGIYIRGFKLEQISAMVEACLNLEVV
jgi:heterodisulfide reductase subunit A